jgi:hypothetical protein
MGNNVERFEFPYWDNNRLDVRIENYQSQILLRLHLKKIWARVGITVLVSLATFWPMDPERSRMTLVLCCATKNSLFFKHFCKMPSGTVSLPNPLPALCTVKHLLSSSIIAVVVSLRSHRFVPSWFIVVVCYFWSLSSSFLKIGYGSCYRLSYKRQATLVAGCSVVLVNSTCLPFPFYDSLIDLSLEFGVLLLSLSLPYIEHGAPPE